jgi:hypothetical protein
MCLWSWAKGICLQETLLPNSKLNAAPIESSRQFFASFDKTGNLLLVVEAGQSFYKASIWNFNRMSSIDLVSFNDLDSQGTCLSVAMLDTTKADIGCSTQVYLNHTLSFVTVEQTCVKVWHYS